MPPNLFGFSNALTLAIVSPPFAKTQDPPKMSHLGGESATWHGARGPWGCAAASHPPCGISGEAATDRWRFWLHRSVTRTSCAPWRLMWRRLLEKWFLNCHHEWAAQLQFDCACYTLRCLRTSHKLAMHDTQGPSTHRCSSRLDLSFRFICQARHIKGI